MTECTTGSQVTGLFVAFVLVFVIHAPPLTYLFVRWRQRFYWGLFPAVFSALSVLPALDAYSGCAVIQTESLSVLLAFGCYFFSWIFLVFFKPILRFSMGREEHIPVVIALPGFGALYAVCWLLFSLGRKRLLMDTGEPVTCKERTEETVILGVGIGILAAMVALGVSL